MAELLFIATTIFVAYVVFVVLGDKKTGTGLGKPVTAKTEIAGLAAEAPRQYDKAPEPTSPRLAAGIDAGSPANKKPAVKPTAPDSVSAQTAQAVDALRNPKTGETAKIPTSYNFAKRWIKEALVEEGLLDKIYKNNELDADANARFQTALQQLKAMDRYR